MESKEICIKAAQNFKGFEGMTITEDTLVFGEGCPLDSLQFVDYCLAVESLAKANGMDVSLVDPQLFLREDKPYRTIGGFIKLLDSLIGKETSMWDYVGHPDVQPSPATKEMSKPRKATELVKLLLCDLDGTLWEGVAGEDDIEPHRDIIEHVYKLQESGILLGIITRNHKSIIEKLPFSKYKDVIDLSRFLIQMYGVDDKATAIKECLAHINLTEHNTAVIDDTPHELDRIKSSLPDIQCFSPGQVFEIAVPEITREDLKRTEMYVQEYDRRKSREGYEGYMEWLASLGMEMSIREPQDEAERNRAQQLLEKANQFNFSRRPEYVMMPDMKQYVASLTDRFGDSGIIAVMRVNGNNLHDFAVSCRVLGRGVEEMLMKWLRSRGVKSFSIQIDERNLAAQEFVARYKGQGSEIDKCSYPIKINSRR